MKSLNSGTAIIGTAKAYRAALREIEELMQAKAGTPEGDRLDVLVTRVEAYERARYPMDNRAA